MGAYTTMGLSGTVGKKPLLLQTQVIKLITKSTPSLTRIFFHVF
jgi:hypothetical protein